MIRLFALYSKLVYLSISSIICSNINVQRFLFEFAQMHGRRLACVEQLALHLLLSSEAIPAKRYASRTTHSRISRNSLSHSETQITKYIWCILWCRRNNCQYGFESDALVEFKWNRGGMLDQINFICAQKHFDEFVVDKHTPIQTPFELPVGAINERTSGNYANLR